MSEDTGEESLGKRKLPMMSFWNHRSRIDSSAFPVTQWLLTSWPAAVALSLLYGLFLYYFVTCLMLAEGPSLRTKPRLLQISPNSSQ